MLKGNKFGKLYNIQTVLHPIEPAPDSWRIPTNSAGYWSASDLHLGIDFVWIFYLVKKKWKWYRY